MVASPQAFMRFEARSLKDLEVTYERIDTLIELTGEGELLEMAQELYDESVAEVPKGTGTLADSAYVSAVYKSGQFQYVDVGYGGPKDKVNPKTGEKASSYMVPVHEDLDAVHPNGNAKFLERPTLRLASKFINNMAKAIRDVL